MEDPLFADARHLRISKKAQKAIQDRVGNLLNQLASEPDEIPDTKLVHRLSDDDRSELLSGIDRILTDVPRQVTTLEVELEQATRRLQVVKAALRKVPEDDVLEPYVRKLNELNRELGTAQAESNRSQEAVRSVDHKIANAERKKKKKAMTG